MSTKRELHFTEAVIRRAARLCKLVGLDAPPAVVATEAVMLLEACKMAWPDETGRAIANYGRDRVLAEHGFCPYCDNDLAQKEDMMCAKCLAEIEEHDVASAE